MDSPRLSVVFNGRTAQRRTQGMAYFIRNAFGNVYIADTSRIAMDTILRSLTHDPSTLGAPHVATCNVTYNEAWEQPGSGETREGQRAIEPWRDQEGLQNATSKWREADRPVSWAEV